MSDWIKTDEELPPCDGSYEICNNPKIINPTNISYDIGMGTYDGYGFRPICREHYVYPSYWRNINLRSKRYGKVIK